MCAGNVSAEGCAVLNWDGDEWSPLCEVEAASAKGSEENAWADMVSSDAPPTHAQLVKLVAVARYRRVVAADPVDGNSARSDRKVQQEARPSRTIIMQKKSGKDTQTRRWRDRRRAECAGNTKHEKENECRESEAIYFWASFGGGDSMRPRREWRWSRVGCLSRGLGKSSRVRVRVAAERTGERGRTQQFTYPTTSARLTHSCSCRVICALCRESDPASRWNGKRRLEWHGGVRDCAQVVSSCNSAIGDSDGEVSF